MRFWREKKQEVFAPARGESHFLCTVYSRCIQPSGQFYEFLFSNHEHWALQGRSKARKKNIVTQIIHILFPSGGSVRMPPHCKPSFFDKQFCMADTAIITPDITFQRNHKEILHTRLMCIYQIHICTFRQD